MKGAFAYQSQIKALEDRCAALERAVAIAILTEIERRGGRAKGSSIGLVEAGDPIRIVFSRTPEGRLDMSFEAAR